MKDEEEEWQKTQPRQKASQRTKMRIGSGERQLMTMITRPMEVEEYEGKGKDQGDRCR